MPVFAMKVVEKNAHERTDTLFIYTFESPALGQRQIVANLTNVYEVGDTVAIAQLDTRLPGVVLKPRKVFGIDSEGMALGPVEAPLDTDLTAQFNADAPAGRFKVTYSVEVEAHYAEDAAPLAAKAIGKKAGELVSSERID
jgi:tRNA-binding EMAP/Myf-like protein